MSIDCSLPFFKKHKGVKVDQHRVLIMRNNPINVLNILIKPTDACNLRCIYCYHADYQYGTEVMPIHVFKELLEKCVGLYKTVRIIWHGGEPLFVGKTFYEQVIQVEKKIEATTGICITNAIQTNGTLLTSEIYNFLKQEGFTFGFSYDGSTNEYTRGLTSKTETAFELLKNDKQKVSTIKVLLNDDLNNIIDVYKYYRDNGLNVRLNPIFHCELVDEKGLSYSLQEYCKAMLKLFEYYIHDSNCNIRVDPFESYFSIMCKGEAFHRICNHASCLGQFLCMNSKGDIYPCSRNFPEDFCLGNISKLNNISDVFESDAFKILVEKAVRRRRKCIDTCSLYKFCLGGCNHDAFMDGDIENNNFFSCLAFKAIFPVIRDYLENISCLEEIENRRIVRFWNAKKEMRELTNNIVDCGE